MGIMKERRAEALSWKTKRGATEAGRLKGAERLIASEGGRRDFLRKGVIGASALWLSGVCGGRRSVAAQTVARDCDVRTFLESSNPDVMRLAQDVFRECVLDKLRPPEGMLKHTWVTAGGGFYGQWIWDPMFVVDLLSLLPGMEQNIRDMFQNYWDAQAGWDAGHPPFMHGLIYCRIHPNTGGCLFSQIPILAWGMERVYQRNRDKELLRQGLVPLERFHEWFWRERDITDIGLIAVGSYDGITQNARFETFDNECNLDTLIMTRHPTRKGPGEGKWYGNICAAGNTAYLVMAERSLARLAAALGDTAMAARRTARVEKAVMAMRAHMWDESSGTFLSVNRDTLEKIPVATIGSWIPLMAEVPTAAMAKRMAEAIQTDHWNTPLPVPTVDRKDKRWKSDDYWRGDVWPAPNYQIAKGLAMYGHRQAAALIADKTVANAIKNGISEHYDALSGKPLGVRFLGMSCTLVTVMLDGLCETHALKLK